jgi:hypothetical protein
MIKIHIIALTDPPFRIRAISGSVKTFLDATEPCILFFWLRHLMIGW